MKLPQFEYARPDSLRDAVALLASHDGEAKVLAGGQSLVPMMAFRVAQPTLLVDLGRLHELRQITIDGNGVRIGAMVTWRQILDDGRLALAHPLLQAAIGHVAHYQIRNRGTVGGSVAHADPAAEMPAIAQTCDAQIVVSGPNGARTIPAKDFFISALTTSLAADEIITEVRLPRWLESRRWGFQEFARRRGDFALAGVALHYDVADGKAANAHLGVFGIGERAQRLAQAEAALNGRSVNETLAAQLGELASTLVDPQEDIHASAPYRRALVGTMAERALLAAIRR